MVAANMKRQSKIVNGTEWMITTSILTKNSSLEYKRTHLHADMAGPSAGISKLLQHTFLKSLKLKLSGPTPRQMRPFYCLMSCRLSSCSSWELAVRRQAAVAAQDLRHHSACFHERQCCFSLLQAWSQQCWGSSGPALVTQLKVNKEVLMCCCCPGVQLSVLMLVSASHVHTDVMLFVGGCKASWACAATLCGCPGILHCFNISCHWLKASGRQGKLVPVHTMAHMQTINCTLIILRPLIRQFVFVQQAEDAWIYESHTTPKHCNMYNTARIAIYTMLDLFSKARLSTLDCVQRSLFKSALNSLFATILQDSDMKSPGVMCRQEVHGCCGRQGRCCGGRERRATAVESPGSCCGCAARCTWRARPPTAAPVCTATRGAGGTPQFRYLLLPTALPTAQSWEQLLIKAGIQRKKSRFWCIDRWAWKISLAVCTTPKCRCN